MWTHTGPRSELFEDAFTNPEEYILLRAFGVYAANELASDLWDWLSAEGLEPTQKNIAKFVAPLGEFDWRAETSPLKGLGGQQGASEAYKVLLSGLANKIPRAKDRLAEIRVEEEQRQKRRLRK